MSAAAWSLDALPGPQSHRGGPRYVARSDRVTTPTGAIIPATRALVVDMANGTNVTAELLGQIMDRRPDLQRHRYVQIRQAIIIAALANHPAAHRADIAAYRARALQGVR